MDDENKKVSLRKKGWTDPETGEYYPGGNPNEISQAANDPNIRNSFAEHTASAFPEFNFERDDSANEIYPNPNQNNASQNNDRQAPKQNDPRDIRSDVQNSGQSGAQDPDLSIHVEYNDGKKFCKFCGKRIPMDAVVCTYCGRQVELLKAEPGKTVVVNRMTVGSNPRNKWISLFLCIFFGTLGIHRFYEGKFKTGLLWLLTGGLFTVGWIVDMVIFLSMEKNRYYIDKNGNRKELK